MCMLYTAPAPCSSVASTFMKLCNGLTNSLAIASPRALGSLVGNGTDGRGRGGCLDFWRNAVDTRDAFSRQLYSRHTRVQRKGVCFAERALLASECDTVPRRLLLPFVHALAKIHGASGADVRMRRVQERRMLRLRLRAVQPGLLHAQSERLASRPRHPVHQQLSAM